MTLEEYAHQAFGAGAAFYLREIADPGAFDRHYAELLVEYRLRPPVRLHPAERRILARGLRRLRQRSSTGSGGRPRGLARDLAASNPARRGHTADHAVPALLEPKRDNTSRLGRPRSKA
jgi:hypothetical protein